MLSRKHLFEVDNFVTKSIFILKACVIFNMGERKITFKFNKISAYSSLWQIDFSKFQRLRESVSLLSELIFFILAEASETNIELKKVDWKMFPQYPQCLFSK